MGRMSVYSHVAEPNIRPNFAVCQTSAHLHFKHYHNNGWLVFVAWPVRQ